MTTRVIALVDMDCFYCQVEEKLNPELQGKPVAVVQYNLWREGGIIAANYLAKEKGVHKGMWKHEAKDVCPEIEFARVAELRGRADLTKYREAGNQVVEVLSTFTNLLERASIDEAYLDLTEAVKQELMKGISNIPLGKLKTTHVVGYDTADFILNISRDQDTDGFCEDDLKLAVGGIIVERIRASIYEKTGYRCSAGIAHNKILAKLVCGLHKPNKQTILPGSSVPQYFSELPLKKIKRLGGKFGKKVAEELNITKVGELLQFSEKELTKKFDTKTGHWLYNIAKGIDNEPVSPKILSKSLSCCKRFPGKNALFLEKNVDYWIKELAIEVAERLTKDQEANNRKAKMATVSFVQVVNKNDVNTSKTFPLRSYDVDVIAHDAFEVVRKNCRKSDGSYYLKYLGLSVGGFEDTKYVKGIKFFLGKKNTQVEKSSETDGMKQDTTESVSFPNEINDVNFTQDIDDNPSLSICDEPKKQWDMAKDLIQCEQETNEITVREDLNDCTKNTLGDCSSTDSRLEIVRDDKNSFFTRYFKNVSSDISRNSNKSIENCADILESVKNDFSSSGLSKSHDNYENSNENITPNSPNDIFEDSNEIFEKDENCENTNKTNYQKCEECGENISIANINSHMDYHFALKLQEQEESTSHGTSNINIKTSDQTSKKRKTCEVRSTSLDLFLSSAKANVEEDTEVCEMCGKNIAISELLSHLDYHAAKNLHKMLNSQNRSHDGSTDRKNSVDNSGIMRFLKRKSS